VKTVPGVTYANMHLETASCLSSGFHYEVDKSSALPSYYAESSGNFLQTYRDNLLVPSSRIKKMGPIGCPEMLVRNYHYSLHNNLQQHSSQPHMFYVTEVLAALIFKHLNHHFLKPGDCQHFHQQGIAPCSKCMNVESLSNRLAH